MTDVVRNYTWGNARRRRRGFRRHGSGCAKFFVPVLILLALWCLWLTRDNFEPHAFIDADSGVEIYITDVIDKRADILRSRVLTLIPESSEGRDIMRTVAEDPPVPEWLLNNLSAGLCHISGPGIEDARQLVLSTRMTRIGSIVERLIRFTPAVNKDYASGLRLRHIPEAGIYYAPRGRTLLLSLSRDSLIHALTLRPDAALDAGLYQEGIHMATGADLFCRIDARGIPLDQPPFEKVEIAVRIERDTARLAVQGRLSPSFMEQYTPFLKGLTPQPLPAPLDGIVSVSMATAMPLPALIASLAEPFPALKTASAFLKQDEEDKDLLEPVTEIQSLMQQTLSDAGATMRLSWLGVEPYEMMPAPVLAATFDADTYRVLALFERIAPAPGVTSGVDLAPRLDDEYTLAYAPFVGGPAIEPAVAIYGNGMLFSTSANVARELLQTAPLTATHPQDGNLYISLKPNEAITAYLDTAREFAVSGLLRNHTETSLEDVMQPWVDASAALDTVVLFVTCDNGALRAELKLAMNDTPGPPESEVPETKSQATDE